MPSSLTFTSGGVKVDGEAIAEQRVDLSRSERGYQE